MLNETLTNLGHPSNVIDGINKNECMCMLHISGEENKSKFAVCLIKGSS